MSYVLISEFKMIRKFAQKIFIWRIYLLKVYYNGDSEPIFQKGINFV